MSRTVEAGVAVLMWIWAWAMVAGASALSWTHEMDAGHVAVILVETADGTEVARFYAADNNEARTFGWRPDLDGREGHVRGEVNELWLAPGAYTLVERVPGQPESRRPLEPSPAPRVLMVKLPEGASAIFAERDGGPAGVDGRAYAPGVGGVAFLPLGDASDGQWSVFVDGGYRSASDDLPPDRQVFTFGNESQPAVRVIKQSQVWMVRVLLVPITLVFLGAGFLALRRLRREPGVLWAILASGAAALFAIQHVLHSPSFDLLQGSIDFTDPVDSVAQLAMMMDAFSTLSDRGSWFNYPEGASWLVTGPSWLGYMVPAVIGALTNPIMGHNLGVAFGVFALSMAAWATARSLGCGQWAALLAGVATPLAPALCRELDKMSLDRSTLYLVPLFFIGMHKAAQEPGWRWPVAGGVALAACFYGQTYYGLYLAAAAPLLVLPRLIGPEFLPRLGRMALMGAVAGALLAPGLYVLDKGTEQTVYQDDTQVQDLDQGTSVSVTPAEVSAFLLAKSRDSHAGQFEMSTRKDRLLAAIWHSNTWRDVVHSEQLPGRSLYWVLAFLTFLVAKQRWRWALSMWDVCVLLLFGFGPYLRIESTITEFPLPFMAYFTHVPGFDQLKAINRFSLLACTMAMVPMAIGIDGLFLRLRRMGRWTLVLRPIVAGGGVVLLSFALVASLVFEEEEWRWKRPHSRQGAPYVDIQVDLPQARSFPAFPALAALEAGPAVALPLSSQTPVDLVMATQRNGIRLVNDPSFGMGAGSDLPMWVEDNGVLNHLAMLTGSERPRRRLSIANTELEWSELHKYGVRYIIMFKDYLPGPELIDDAVAYLDAHRPRLAEDAQVIVWGVAKPPS